jgi:hypothetical protein
MPINNTGDLISRAVLERAFEQLDVDAMVKEILPQIKKQVQRDILQAVKDYDFTDMIYNALDGEGRFSAALGKKISAAVLSSVA